MTSGYAGLFILLLSLFLPGHAMAEADVLETQPAQVNPQVLAVIFSGEEALHYRVSWSGGIKIDDIYMTIKPETSRPDAFLITTKVKSFGPLHLFYPVDDTFRCFVSGPMKLPYRYEVHQKEGYTEETTRLTLYDQQLRIVRYQTNQGPQRAFAINGTVYNEFASFIISRALRYREGEDIVVPTFAEEKRNEVRVALLGRQQRNTLFGAKATLKVQPILHFKGLYNKSGDTILWLTDDACRVPVEIHSKITVGSLVAELVGYTNPACKEREQRPVR